MIDVSGDEAAARRAVAARMGDAARAWLGSLDVSQRRIATGAVPAGDDSDAERRRWFYTPTDHGGLTMHQQRPPQQPAAMRLVASGLSTAGYVTVATTMGLENVLDQAEGFVTLFDRDHGRDPGRYYLRVFGEPDRKRPWGAVRRPSRVAHQPRRRQRAAGTPSVPPPHRASWAPSRRRPRCSAARSTRPLPRVEGLARELVRSLPPHLAGRAILLDEVGGASGPRAP